MATGGHVQQHVQQTDVQQATAYSAQQAVLLFINTQNYYCNGEGPLRQAAMLQQLQAARACGIDIMYCITQSLTADGHERSLHHKLAGVHIHPGSWEAQVIDTITPAPSDLVLPKFTSSAFNSTPLDSILRSLDKQYIIIAGCMTDECVDHTVRDAADHNYNVTLLSDCCAAPSAERQQQGCNALSRYCKQQKLGALLQELVALAAKAVIGPVVTAPRTSAGGTVPYLAPSSIPPQFDIPISRRRVYNVPGLVMGQDAAAAAPAAAPAVAGRYMTSADPAEFAAMEMQAAPAMDLAGAAKAVQNSSISAPADMEQYNMDDFAPEQQHKAESANPDSDGSGTDDLRADTAQVAAPEGFKQAASKSTTSGSNKRQSFKGRTTSPYTSRKEPRKMYFEYAKQQWETEGEFMLPNGQTWVEVVVKGDPSRSERGLVYCKLCRHYDKSNTFGRGYRAGKRTALREHMQTKDHKELVKALEEGRVTMPTTDAAVPTDEQLAAFQQPDEGTEAAEAQQDSAEPAADEPITAAAASALMQLGTSASPEQSRGGLVSPVTPSTLGGILSKAMNAHPGALREDMQPAAAALPRRGSGVNRVVLAAAVAKIAAAAGLSNDGLADVSRKLQQYLNVAGDDLTPEKAATAITVAFSGTADAGLSSETLKRALASLAGGSGPSGAASPR
eukprot:GHUV01006038.1.p1 GENE.GHUV01006038.1~~GHUV01006038.1.p1  ORF type:complete len:675 (+),score=270.70 GHUV01006038.1:374-2398(+)